MGRRERIKLAAIGGGTGLSTLLRGLKSHVAQPNSPIDLTAIVTVTDDGKSSGRLRQEFTILPPGDIRNCLVALADDGARMTRIFRHRFPGDGPLGGHALGNLILLALSQQEGDFLSAIEVTREMLGVRPRVLPSTLSHVILVARVGSRIIRGQVAIKSQEGPIEELRISPPYVQALPEAIAAIRDADVITLGPGSLFTSVISNLLIREIAEELVRSRARKIYICNAMTEYDETDGMTAADHVRTLLSYAPDLKLDYALFNSSPISAEMRERYAAEKAVALDPPTEVPPDLAGIEFIALPLASEDLFVRHDPDRLCRAILEISSY